MPFVGVSEFSDWKRPLGTHCRVVVCVCVCRLESVDKCLVVVGDNCRAIVLFIGMIREFLIALTYKDYNLMLTWNR